MVTDPIQDMTVGDGEPSMMLMPWGGEKVLL